MHIPRYVGHFFHSEQATHSSRDCQTMNIQTVAGMPYVPQHKKCTKKEGGKAHNFPGNCFGQSGNIFSSLGRKRFLISQLRRVPLPRITWRRVCQSVRLSANEIPCCTSRPTGLLSKCKASAVVLVSFHPPKNVSPFKRPLFRACKLFPFF